MKKYYTLRIVGDEDVLLDDVLLYEEVYYLRERTKPKRVVDILQNFIKRLKPIKGKEYYYEELISYIEETNTDLKGRKSLPSILNRYGGNRTVILEESFYPEDYDYS